MLIFAEPMTKCPVCNGALRSWGQMTRKGDDYQFDQCVDCRLVMVNPRPTQASLLQHYEQGEFNAQPWTSEQHLAQESRVPNATVDAARMMQRLLQLRPMQIEDRLLDVGSGSGFFSREARQAGLQVEAIELDPQSRQWTLEIAGIHARAVAYEELDPTQQHYPYILMSQVLEHVVDVRSWMKHTHELLAPGGVLAIAVPNFDSLFRRLWGTGDPFFIPPDHLNYFNRRSLTRWCQQAGLQVLHIEEVSRLARDVLSKRLKLPGVLDTATQCSTSLLSTIFDHVARWSHSGMFLNVYAVKG